ncbi:MAG: FAD-dependent oxidoreductase [Melioribacteraceae bacterium]
MRTQITIIIISLFLSISCQTNQQEKYFDVVVYGGTSAGVAAAIQISRMGKSVVIIEPSSRIGGLTSGGLGATDIGNKHAIGGISREFYQNIKKHYNNNDNWNWQNKSEYMTGGQTKTSENEDAMWTFEPSTALSVYRKMLNDEKAEISYNQRLDRSSGVKKENNSIISIAMETGEIYFGKMFIDATYEGDLMAAAGISYTVGRESNLQYGENLNGIQANDTSLTFKGVVSLNGKNHNFVDGVSPYINKGDRKSGTLPYVNTTQIGKQGETDKKLQAYCFRMCLTDHPENRIPFSKPHDYAELNYELLFRNYEAGFNEFPWINSKMPNRKTDTNNRTGFSTDFIGQNYEYPEATYEERKSIIEKHRTYQQGLMWSLAYHPRIPQRIRDVVSRWGTCKDEFERNDGWQQQLYIREARRLISDLVMTQKHCEGIDIVEDAIGLAAYGMDSHNTQRYITKNGYVRNEGNVEAKAQGPFPIGYRAIIPKESECTNLAIPICLSATHIAFGSIRMEPVFMVLGQSAATAAVLAIQNNVSLQNVDYDLLSKQLKKDRQRF